MAFTGIRISRLKLISRAYPVPLPAIHGLWYSCCPQGAVPVNMPSEAVMRTGSLLLLVWPVIGVIACGQRHYYSSSDPNCTRAGTITVTIIAGPLNYLGVNPKVSSKAPHPSS
jgi:hypothetical protein